MKKAIALGSIILMYKLQNECKDGNIKNLRC